MGEGEVMAQSFAETAHLKIDKKKFEENFDRIDWGKPAEAKYDPKKVKRNKKHATAGMCGEYGMSTFDEEKYKENFDQIDWSKKVE